MSNETVDKTLLYVKNVVLGGVVRSRALSSSGVIDGARLQPKGEA
jgi:hypothetical protein